MEITAQVFVPWAVPPTFKGGRCFGYNRSYGQNIPGEIGISDYVFGHGGGRLRLGCGSGVGEQPDLDRDQRAGTGLAALLDSALELADQVPGPLAICNRGAPRGL